MSKFKNLLLCLVLASLAFGCRPDNVDPSQNPDSIAGSYVPVARPSVQCGPSMFSRLKDGSVDLGSVEIMNSSSNIYLVFDLNQYKYLDAIKIYKGELSSMPLDSDGQVDLENFSFQPNLSQPLNDYTLMAPLSTTPSCTDIVIWARITTRGMFGNITATNYAWVTGTPVANGYYLRYCAPACSTVSTGIGNTN